MKRLTTCLGLLALLAGCEGPTDPAGIQPLSAARGGRGTDTTVNRGAPHLLRFLPWAPPLVTHDTARVVRQGRHSWFSIYHQSDEWFLSMDIPPSAQFVYADGTPVPAGQEVIVRAVVDSTYIRFEFEPHGSYFTGPRPVQLWVSLKYVDFEGRGQLPDIWYQAEPDEPWVPIPAEARVNGRWLVIKLRHFSNYAVAY